MKSGFYFGNIDKGQPVYRLIQRGNYRPTLEYVRHTTRRELMWFVETETQEIPLPYEQDAMTYSRYLNGERVYA